MSVGVYVFLCTLIDVSYVTDVKNIVIGILQCIYSADYPKDYKVF